MHTLALFDNNFLYFLKKSSNDVDVSIREIIIQFSQLKIRFKKLSNRKSRDIELTVKNFRIGFILSEDPTKDGTYTCKTHSQPKPFTYKSICDFNWANLKENTELDLKIVYFLKTNYFCAYLFRKRSNLNQELMHIFNAH